MPVSLVLTAGFSGDYFVREVPVRCVLELVTYRYLPYLTSLAHLSTHGELPHYCLLDVQSDIIQVCAGPIQNL